MKYLQKLKNGTRERRVWRGKLVDHALDEAWLTRLHSIRGVECGSVDLDGFMLDIRTEEAMRRIFEALVPSQSRLNWVAYSDEGRDFILSANGIDTPFAKQFPEALEHDPAWFAVQVLRNPEAEVGPWWEDVLGRIERVCPGRTRSPKVPSDKAFIRVLQREGELVPVS